MFSVYGVWQVGPDTCESRLITAKARVAPSLTKNTLRMELNTGVLVMRAGVRVLRALLVKPTQVYVIGDSETILGAREMDAKYYNEYFYNRIVEMWENQRKMGGVY